MSERSEFHIALSALAVSEMVMTLAVTASRGMSDLFNQTINLTNKLPAMGK